MEKRIVGALAAIALSLLATGRAEAQKPAVVGVQRCGPASDGMRRVALVIGNGDYRHVVKLGAPQADSQQVANALCGFGFEYVDFEQNLTKSAMQSHLATLRAQVNDKTKLSLVYYSGHGDQKNGLDYLIPVDVSLAGANPFSGTVPLTDVVSALGPARDDLARLVVLDSCRDDAIRSDNALPQISDPSVYQSLMVASATAPGLQASGVRVGAHKNSPYTWALLTVLAEADGDVFDAHVLAGLLASSWTTKHLGTGEREAPTIVPTPPDFRSPVYYKPPSAGPRSPALTRYTIQDMDEAVWEDDTVKSVESTAPTTGMSLQQLLRKAQDALNATAKMSNGRPLSDAFGHVIYAPNFADAARYWQAASRLGSVTATRRLAQLTYSGRGVDRNYQAAMGLLEQAADKGDVRAIEELGDAYRDGDRPSREPNYARAIVYYTKAYRSGLPAAEADLGYMYLWGYGVPEDTKRAFRMLKEAEAAGAPEASSWLGWMYWAGRGTDRNIPAAIAEFRRATDQGDSRGMEYLSKFYEAGFGIGQDLKKARELFSRAASQVNVWYIKEYDLDKD